MLTINKLQNWANSVPSNIKAMVAMYLAKMDFSYMTLDEDTHTYSSTKDPDIGWTSVTTLIPFPPSPWSKS